jgi:hypothetical protein
MQPPPFRTSAIVASLARECDAACDCAPSADVETRTTRERRLRLADLDHHLHCSVIGTCVGTAELRRLVPRHADVDRDRATDLEIHHAAVELAIRGGSGARALEKLLDERHALTLRRLRDLVDEAGLESAWDAALQAGEVPGAYWALLTHPRTTEPLRQRAFGDVHMLSHLVGAANRADIRRLVALERENADLKERLERVQERSQALHAEREAALAAAARDIAGLRAKVAARDAQDDHDIGALRAALQRRDLDVERQTARRELAERASAATTDDARRLQAELARARATLAELHGEIGALEAELRPVDARDAAGAGATGSSAWSGRRVLYVGGRPSSNDAIRALCERAGIELELHDGGIEDRKGLLHGAVPGADVVLFPVDCIDHDSMSNLKRLCARHGVPFRPLRTAGIASVLAALAERPGGSPEATDNRCGVGCRRHA